MKQKQTETNKLKRTGPDGRGRLAHTDRLLAPSMVAFAAAHPAPGRAQLLGLDTERRAARRASEVHERTVVLSV